MTDLHLGRHGALRHDAALDTFGPYAVRRERRLRRWTAPWAGVLVEAARADDWITLASAAVELASHPDAILTGATAARLHGLTALEPLPVHLQIPYEHPLRSRSGLRVHNGPLEPDDRDVVDGLPVLRLDRVLADLLCTGRPGDALAVMDQALARVPPDGHDPFRAAVAKRIRERRDPRGTVRGPHLLDLATGRAESPAESWLLWQIVDAGFPIPEVNFRITDLDGHGLYRIDLAWPEQRIALEYHGYAAHVGRTAEDEARAEDLRRRGWTVVVVWLEDSVSGRFHPELDAAFRGRGLDTSRRQLGVLSGRRHREPSPRTT